MSNEEFILLAEKVAAGEASSAELALYNTAYDSFQRKEVGQPALPANIDELEKTSIYRLRKKFGVQPVTVKLWPKVAVAVAAVTAITIGVWFYNISNHHVILNSVQDPALAMNDIAPGKNGATLTLANGKVIQLSDAKSGVVIGEDRLAYNDGSEIDHSSLSRSDISPRGGESSAVAQTTKGQTYIFTLPDGTKVWLNAASKLHIPSGFSGTETRKVELSGEAYFEVAKDKKRPFIVKTVGNEGRPGQEVTVLGTHFNINSYGDEASVKTTLLEGSVRVAKEGTGIVLKPNQQSIVTGSDRIAVREANLAEAIAWKNGDFVFDHEDFESIIRKVEKWYDVEFVYEKGKYNTLILGGTVSRNNPLSVVLASLQKAGGLKFKIEGRRVTIM